MTTVAALGPENTFSERTARGYLAALGASGSVRLYPTLRRAFQAAGGECDCAVLPIENMVEGYVQPVLDLLLDSDLAIVDEFIIPVEFCFVATCGRKQDVGRVYAQFVTQGQCVEFLESLHHAEIVTTSSNGASLEMIRKGGPNEGAIIPSYAFDKREFAFAAENVSDYPNNRTRFIVIGGKEKIRDAKREYKTSLVVVEGKDRPGMLAEILAAFSKRSVNLVSIMSRPTKETLGKYHFFIDIEGHATESRITEALADVQRHHFVRLLGSYPKAKV